MEAALAERVLQAGDIAVHEGLDVRVRGRRRAPLVLAQLRHHLAGERHRKLGEFTRQKILDRPLVGRVLVRVKEADGQCFHLARDQVGDRAAHLVEVDRHADRAVSGHPLVDLATEVPGHQGLGELQKEIVDVVALLDSHLERVAEAPCREKRKPGARPLDDGVGDQRRPVDELTNLRQRESGGAKQLVQSHQCADGRIFGRRQALVDPDSPAHRVQQHEVSERSPDVHADPIPSFTLRRNHWRPPQYSDSSPTSRSVISTTARVITMFTVPTAAAVGSKEKRR